MMTDGPADDASFRSSFLQSAARRERHQLAPAHSYNAVLMRSLMKLPSRRSALTRGGSSAGSNGGSGDSLRQRPRDGCSCPHSSRFRWKFCSPSRRSFQAVFSAATADRRGGESAIIRPVQSCSGGEQRLIFSISSDAWTWSIGRRLRRPPATAEWRSRPTQRCHGRNGTGGGDASFSRYPSSSLRPSVQRDTATPVARGMACCGGLGNAGRMARSSSRGMDERN